MMSDAEVITVLHLFPLRLQLLPQLQALLPDLRVRFLEGPVPEAFLVQPLHRGDASLLRRADHVPSPVLFRGVHGHQLCR